MKRFTVSLLVMGLVLLAPSLIVAQTDYPRRQVEL